MAIYSHPEYYPPTINATINLSDVFENVDLVYIPIKKNQWAWPKNVKLREAGWPVFYGDKSKPSLFLKLFGFITFCTKFIKVLITTKPKFILVYDNYALLCLKMCSFIIPSKAIIWYHNHDISDSLKGKSKFSIQYWAIKNEKTFFRNIDIFTIPSKDRINHFKIDQIKGMVKVIPNFPSLKIFKTSNLKILKNSLKVIFVGSIAHGRGLIEFLNLMPISIGGINVELKIIGYQSNKKLIKDLFEVIRQKKLEKIVSITEAIPYSELITACEDAHLGLGFYLSGSIMDKTISTASNKIFEYAAMGKPVISNIILPADSWLIYSTPLENDIKKALKYCVDNYQTISKKAAQEFIDKNNFEYNFLPFLKDVMEYADNKFQYN